MVDTKYDIEKNYEELIRFFRSEIVSRVCIDDCTDRHGLVLAIHEVLPEIFLKFFGVVDENGWASQLIEDVTGDEGIKFYLGATSSVFNLVGEIVNDKICPSCGTKEVLSEEDTHIVICPECKTEMCVTCIKNGVCCGGPS